MYKLDEKKYKFMTNKILKLNKKQNEAYSSMVNGENIFITGPGGVGKSAIIKLFYKMYKDIKNISITSTTGTSAVLINGTTLHSYLGIGLGNLDIDSLVKKIKKKSYLMKRWKNIECLIIDEVSMLDPNLFDKLEEMARILRKNEEPFGGIQIIISGDFLQLPCIGTEKFCFQADSWDKCIDKTVYLNEIIRQRNKKFQSCLNEIRIGNITEEVKKILNSRKNIKLKNSFGIKPTKLFSKNINVNKINDIELDILAKDERQFYEYDIYIINHKKCKEFFIEKTIKNCNAPENLQLCVGAQVMLLSNLDVSSGLANGSRGVIINFVNDLPLVKFLNGEERVIDHHTWDIEENGNLMLQINQIPLKVAYAISIHKSQGCSLDCCEIDLSNIFEYGQAYVALSRVKNLEGLSIIDVNYNLIQAHPKANEYYFNLL